ncbi:MAG: peptide ABC transporter substrate-binding protein [Anaerolineaceae bacterium]|nr:peptide ABC transporter substrate-binding protein [Anaerolineaceae bacterium]
MQKFRWQLLIVLMTGLLVGMVLFFQQQTPAEEMAETPSPISGGSYTEALVGSLMRLNPMLDHFNQPDRDIDRLLFSSLIRFDARGLPVGDLAQSWNVSTDGAVYTVNLRTDAVWHDGNPVTADDVIYTISLLQSQSALIPTSLQEFWGQAVVSKISDSGLEFSLPVAFAPFMDYLSFQVLPSHLLGNLFMDALVDHPFNLNPVGSGPYRFDSLETDNGVITGVNLTSFEYYYEGRPFIDEIHFRYYGDEKSALDAYQAGEVDGLSKIRNQDMETVLNQTGLNLYSSRQPKLCIVFLNLNNPDVPILQRVDFRKALMAGVNRQMMIDDVVSGQGIFAQGPIMPGNWAFYPEQTAYRYDPDGARQILAGMALTSGEDGRFFSDGAPIELNLMVPDDTQHTAMAEILRQNWEKIGVGVTVIPLPYDQVIANLESRSYQMALVDVDLSDTPDPDPYQFWAESQIENGQNYAQWSNTTASSYLEQARQTPNIEMRTRLYRNFQVLFEEDLPSLPLFYPVYNYAVKDSINDLNFGPVYNPADRFNNVHEWYILTGVE